MDVWEQARERYAQGGITQGELAEEFGLTLASVRRHAAQEKWSQLRQPQIRGASEKNTRIARQLRMTDRMLDIIEKALVDEDELFGRVEFNKSSSGGEFVQERLRFLNDERLGRLIRTAADIFELQRTVLEIHDYKDELSARKYEADAKLASRKLKQQTELAERKLDLELLKLERDRDAGCEPDDFLLALGIGDGDERDAQSS